MPHQKDGSLITLLSLRTILDFFSHQKMYHYFLKQLPVGNSATSATFYLMQLQRLFSAIFFFNFSLVRDYTLYTYTSVEFGLLPEQESPSKSICLMTCLSLSWEAILLKLVTGTCLKSKLHRGKDALNAYFSNASWWKSLVTHYSAFCDFSEHQVLPILLATSPKSNGFWSILIFYYNNMISFSTFLYHFEDENLRLWIGNIFSASHTIS